MEQNITLRRTVLPVCLKIPMHVVDIGITVNVFHNNLRQMFVVVFFCKLKLSKHKPRVSEIIYIRVHVYTYIYIYINTFHTSWANILSTFSPFGHLKTIKCPAT